MLRRNLIANYLGQGWTALMTLAFIPFYIKYLGIEAYGLIGLFAVLQAWLGLVDMGMTPTLSREMARFTGGSRSAESIRDLLRTIEVIASGIAFLMAAGIALASNWIATSWLKAEALPTETVAHAFAIMGLVTALRFVEGLYRSTIVGLQKQVLFNVVSSVMVTLRGLGAVGILIWVSPTIEAFFLWQGVVSVIALMTLGFITYQSIPPGNRSAQFSLVELRGVGRFAGGMMGITLLSLLLMQVDKVLLSKLLSLSDFGYYTLATVVAGALYTLISPITQAVYPKLCQLHVEQNNQGLASAFHNAAQLVTVVAGSAALVLILFSENAFRLWTKDPHLATQVAPLVSLLAVGNFLNGLMWVPYSTQVAYGWTSLAVRINIVAVLIIVPAMVLVVPRYGAEGAAWVWVFLNAGYFLIGIHLMFLRILTTEKWAWYFKDVLAPLCAGLVVALSLLKVLSNQPGFYFDLKRILIVATSTLLAATFASSYVYNHLQNIIKKTITKTKEMVF